jgi:hypothetical protein
VNSPRVFDIGCGELTFRGQRKAAAQFFVFSEAKLVMKEIQDARVQFLAWKHRRDYPIIKVTTPSSSSISDPDVVVIPRTLWDGVTSSTTNLNPDVVVAARARLGRSDFHSDIGFQCCRTVGCLKPSQVLVVRAFSPYITGISSLALMTLSSSEFAAEVLCCDKDQPRFVCA